MPIYGTKLTIKDLEIHDKGYYKCEATNGEEKVDSTGILIVNPGQWREYLFVYLLNYMFLLFI